MLTQGQCTTTRSFIMAIPFFFILYPAVGLFSPFPFLTIQYFLLVLNFISPWVLQLNVLGHLEVFIYFPFSSLALLAIKLIHLVTFSGIWLMYIKSIIGDSIEHCCTSLPSGFHSNFLSHYQSHSHAYSVIPHLVYHISLQFSFPYQ